MQDHRETLSTLMDGEIEDQDWKALKHIAEDDDARGVWGRYHLIGDVMRDGVVEIAPMAFSERLRDEIAREPTVLAPPRRRQSLRRPVAGLAIAASVAALAVVGVNQMTQEQTLDKMPEIAVSAPVATEQSRLPLNASTGEAPIAVDPFEALALGLEVHFL